MQNNATEYRVAGCFIACLIGVGVPAFLLGPFLFEGISLQLASTTVIVISIVLALFGLWLLVVSIFTETVVIEKVITPFQGGEAVFIFLPYMLFVGTKAIWLRIVGGNKNVHR